MPSKQRYLLYREGRYFARVVVPKNLRQAVGRIELRKPLGADRKSAQRALPGAVAALQAQIERARLAMRVQAPTRRPTQVFCLAAVAQKHYRLALERDDAKRNCGPIATLGFVDENYIRWLKRAVAGSLSDTELDYELGEQIRGYAAHGVPTGDIGSTTWRSLARTIAGVELELLAREAERDEGDFSGQPTLPELVAVLPETKLADAVPIGDLFTSYIKELQRSGKGSGALKRWKPVIESLIQFLHHDDANSVTRSDIMRWREMLLEKHAPKTVRDVYLAAVKSVFQWGVDSDRLARNPASGIKTRVPSKPKGREKGFDDKEAAALLHAAWNYISPQSNNPKTRESEIMTNAKRWIPLLCAFTGARVAEIAQLRKEDLRNDRGTFVLRITPDAGSTKSGKFRDVPLHSQVVGLGFPKFVANMPDGPLFYSHEAPRTGKDHPSKYVAQRVSTWIRALGVVAKDVQPSHGWRHRFKTIGIENSIDARVLDAIQGHAAKTSGEHYGDVTLQARIDAIARFPAIDF